LLVAEPAAEAALEAGAAEEAASEEAAI
jgi:hypothetical protein